MPALRASSTASSSAWAASTSASSRSSAARAPGASARHAGSAARAAATAASASAAPARGTSASTASVAGSSTVSCSLTVLGPAVADRRRNLPLQPSSYGDSAIAGSACSTSSSSMVRIGPVNVFRADTANQIVTAAITPIVTSGA